MQAIHKNDLTKGEIYINLLDKVIPLRFTGEIKYQDSPTYGYGNYYAIFNEVRTIRNKNYPLRKGVWKRLSSKDEIEHLIAATTKQKANGDS